jgi:N-acetylglutamate synthase-like GNAT family acetyltransferase
MSRDRTIASGQLFAQPLAVWERDGLAAALRGADLPAADIGDPDRLFWRYETTDQVPVGFGGLDVHGHDALLRSLVTLPPLRRRGYGRQIVAALEVEAVARGCRAGWVLTASGAAFFERLGYRACDRADMPAAIRGTAEFAAAPAATVMTKAL